MIVNIIAYGIAKDILGSRKIEFTLTNGDRVKDLKSELVKLHPRFAALVSLAVAIDEEYRSDDYLLIEGKEVVIIPPVSGG